MATICGVKVSNFHFPDKLFKVEVLPRRYRNFVPISKVNHRYKIVFFTVRSQRTFQKALFQFFFSSIHFFCLERFQFTQFRMQNVNKARSKELMYSFPIRCLYYFKGYFIGYFVFEIDIHIFVYLTLGITSNYLRIRKGFVKEIGKPPFYQV